MKKILLIIIGVALAAVIGLSSFLYSRLGEESKPEQLSLFGTVGGDEIKREVSGTDEVSGTTDREPEEGETHSSSDTSSEEDTSQTVEEETKPPRTEPKAMDFEVYDINGNKVKLSDHFGKPIVLNFWASWCGPCQMEMPDFNQKYLEHGDEVQFFMVNMTTGRETLSSAKSFISSNGYSLPVFFDTDSDAADTYAVYSLPTTYFIDAEGYLIAKATGAIDGETLQQGIDMIK